MKLRNYQQPEHKRADTNVSRNVIKSKYKRCYTGGGAGPAKTRGAFGFRLELFCYFFLSREKSKANGRRSRKRLKAARKAKGRRCKVKGRKGERHKAKDGRQKPEEGL